jgi:hypothetical protein
MLQLLEDLWRHMRSCEPGQADVVCMVNTTVISLTELSCWRKSYTDKTTLFICLQTFYGRHHEQNDLCHISISLYVDLFLPVLTL